MSKPRVIVTLSEGLIAGVAYHGIDLSHVELICIDTDTEGADEDELVQIGGDDAFMSTGTMDLASDVDIADIEAAQEAGPWTIEDWRYEVANGDTRLGFEDWLAGKIEADDA
jgi:hypothetical protein